jgi:hypothetical protein
MKTFLLAIGYKLCHRISGCEGYEQGEAGTEFVWHVVRYSLILQNFTTMAPCRILADQSPKTSLRYNMVAKRKQQEIFESQGKKSKPAAPAAADASLPSTSGKDKPTVAAANLANDKEQKQLIAAPGAAALPAAGGEPSGFKNKEKVLILSTRGITFR